MFCPNKGGWAGLGKQALPEALPPVPLPLCLLASCEWPSHTPYPDNSPETNLRDQPLSLPGTLRGKRRDTGPRVSSSGHSKLVREPQGAQMPLCQVQAGHTEANQVPRMQPRNQDRQTLKAKEDLESLPLPPR